MNQPPRQSQRRSGNESSGSSLLANEPLLLLALVIVALYYARSILIPLALALTLSFLLAPAVERLQRLRIRRVPATMLVIVAATAFLGGIMWMVAGQLLTVVNDLPNHSANIRAKLAVTHIQSDSRIGQAITSLEAVAQELANGNQEVVPPSLPADQGHVRRRGRASTTIETVPPGTVIRPGSSPGTAAGPAPVVIVETPPTEAAYLRELLVPVLGPLGTAGMVIVFAIYLLLKREDLRNRLLLIAGIGRLNIVTQALDDAAARVSRYLIANVSVNAGCGLVFAGGLFAIGLPNATLWGAMLALLRMVPYVGPLVGGVLPTIFALVIFPTWWQAGCVVAMMVVLELVVANFLEPWLYGSHTGISALALVVMAIVWTLLWGWAGLALSTPLTVCLIVTGQVLPQMSFLHILLGDEAELAPSVHLYERLLAMDQAEAHLITERYLEQHSTLQLYDQVVLPALGMEEQDRHKGVLEEERAQFLLQSAQELIEELTEFGAPEPAGAEGKLPPVAEVTARRCPVVCVPTGDQADEIAATMLAQLLERAGHKTLLLPAAALSPELLARFAEDLSMAVCISAVPPLAFVPTRTLCARIRKELPFNRIIIGLWGSTSSPETLKARFGSARPYSVVTTLADALQQFASELQVLPAESIFARSGPLRPDAVRIETVQGQDS